MNKLDLPALGLILRCCRPADGRMPAAGLLSAALLLSGCFGDMRGGDVTRPHYVNPLDEYQTAQSPEPAPIEAQAAESGNSARVRYIQALEGDTARTIAGRAGADPLQVAEMNGLLPDSPLSAGRIIVVPAGSDVASPEDISRIASSALDGGESDAAAAGPGAVAAAAPATVKLKDPFGDESELPAPPAADQPLPEDIETVALPASPEFSQYQSPVPATRFQFPVKGEIIRGYSDAPGGNEGIDIAAPAGSPVVAAGEGEVAMLSRSSDETAILLLRHPDNHYTVYSNLTDVSVEKGQQVTRGQNLGAVAGGENEFLHFEVRIGTESTDPVPYIF